MSARYEFIDAEKATRNGDGTPRYTVVAMCGWLAVSTSGFYEWAARPASATALRREGLSVLIRVFEHHQRRRIPRPDPDERAGGHHDVRATAAPASARRRRRGGVAGRLPPAPDCFPDVRAGSDHGVRAHHRRHQAVIRIRTIGPLRRRGRGCRFRRRRRAGLTTVLRRPRLRRGRRPSGRPSGRPGRRVVGGVVVQSVVVGAGDGDAGWGARRRRVGGVGVGRGGQDGGGLGGVQDPAADPDRGQRVGGRGRTALGLAVPTARGWCRRW